MITIKIPKNANLIIKMLESHGHEAYVVGGCVRDSILDREPKDWDICTSATPDQVLDIFRLFSVIKTGLKHGTVTIVILGEPYEVTTYRIDGEYSDSRHPDNVEFTKSLREDLSRRDFTINAMAYNDKDGLIDYFGGCQDLERRTIRCVGYPGDRFSEDALRILRAIRFSSQLSFHIHPNTRVSMFTAKDDILKVSAERIRTELVKTLTGTSAEYTLGMYAGIIAVIIPEILPMIGLDQKNPYHDHDVWDHTLNSIMGIQNHPVLRLTMLFHDIGKPECMVVGEDGVGHFYGHPDKSAEIAVRVMKRLRFDTQTINTVKILVENHDAHLVASDKYVRKMLRSLGEENTRLLIKVRRADILAQSTKSLPSLQGIIQFEEVLEKVLREEQCFSLKDLAVNGNDLIGLGMMTGKRVGNTLQRLLDMVIEDEVENDKAALLAAANEIMSA